MPKTQFDLHIHTYYSDGRDSPEELLYKAKKLGLSLVSITDHNSFSHIPEEEAIARRLKVNLLPGIELSTIYQNRHLHLLGYNFALKNRELGNVIKKIQGQRRRGIFRIAKKLRHLGFDIKDAELKKLPAEYFGLSHIIHILLNKPSEQRRILKEVGSADIFAVINHYFSEASEAYVPEDYLPAIKMIKLIKQSGGITSLAHPGSHLSYHDDPIIAALQASGLDGLEVFTPKHNWDQIIHYEMLAKKLKMVITAGSNYHEDFHQQDIPIVTPLGFLKTPKKVFFNFINFLQSKTSFEMKFKR